MKPLSRRRVLSAAFLAAVAPLLPLRGGRRADAADQNAPADLVVLDANVLTVSDVSPRAEAFAVSGGRFAAVGKTREIRKFIGPKTKVLSLKGKTVVPGFNDAHAHPSPYFPEDSPLGIVNLGPPKVRTIEDLIAALKRKADKTPKGQVISGFGYQDTKLGRHPTRQDLDKASTEHPIIISHSSGHVGSCNSFALNAAHITKDTKDPAGGLIGRDENGEPNGYLAESARSLTRGVGTAPPQPTPEQTAEGLAACLRRYAARGITSVGIAGSSPHMVETLRKMRDAGTLTVRQYVMLREGDVEALSAETEAADSDEAKRGAGRGGPGDEWVRVGAIKTFHGNSLSGRTCWLSEPYLDKPGYYGVPPARSQEDLNALVRKIHDAGLQFCCHSNGDREIEMVLTAVEKAQKESPRRRARHRIEHCSVVTPALLDRIKKADMIIVPHSYEWEHGDKMEAYGPKRWDWMHPNRSALTWKIPVAGHSDSPVSAADPLLRLQCMVTRKSEQGKIYGAKQSVTPEEALHIWTMGSAFASFEETEKGSITVGKWADFVVLDKDLTKGNPDEIRNIPIALTYVGGKATFDAATDKVDALAFCPHHDAAAQRWFYTQIAPERASAYFCRCCLSEATGGLPFDGETPNIYVAGL